MSNGLARTLALIVDPVTSLALWLDQHSASVTALVTAVLVGVTIYYAIQTHDQVKEMRKSREVSERATLATQQAAEATSQSAAATARAADIAGAQLNELRVGREAAVRPYLMVVAAEMHWPQGAASLRGAQVVGTVQNLGLGPALGAMADLHNTFALTTPNNRPHFIPAGNEVQVLLGQVTEATPPTDQLPLLETAFRLEYSDLAGRLWRTDGILRIPLELRGGQEWALRDAIAVRYTEQDVDGLDARAISETTTAVAMWWIRHD